MKTMPHHTYSFIPALISIIFRKKSYLIRPGVKARSDCLEREDVICLPDILLFSFTSFLFLFFWIIFYVQFNITYSCFYLQSHVENKKKNKFALKIVAFNLHTTIASSVKDTQEETSLIKYSYCFTCVNYAASLFIHPAPLLPMPTIQVKMYLLRFHL